jgi:hypothetical protein
LELVEGVHFSICDHQGVRGITEAVPVHVTERTAWIALDNLASGDLEGIHCVREPIPVDVSASARIPHTVTMAVSLTQIRHPGAVVIDVENPICVGVSDESVIVNIRVRT